MTGDEMERAIEFLLKSQANFEARQANFDAEREETNRQIRDLAVAQRRTQEQLDQLSDTVSAQSQQIAHLSNVVADIAEGQRRNTEDIDALVKLVGGIIEGRGNGGTTGA